MSQSIVSAADLTGIVRAGNLGIYGLDSGTGFNIDLGLIPAQFPQVMAGATQTIRAGAVNSGTVYNISGTVNWAGLVVQIPVGARITKIRMLCTGEATLSGSIVLAGSNTYTAIVSAAASCVVLAPSSSYAPNAHNDLAASQSNSEITPTSTINLSASCASGSVIVDRTWDFGVILPGGLSYITRAALLTNFTAVKIQLVNGTQATLFLNKVGGAFSDTGTADAAVHLTTVIWEMIIDFEEPWTIISILPNPAAPGDLVTITGTNLDQLLPLPDSIQWTDDAGVTQTVAITDATLIDSGHITFTIPPIVTVPPTDPPFVGATVTIFSGAVPIGTIVVYNATGSGIYRIIANQRHDTLYNRATTPISTVDVKIPDPFFETGFIGG